MHYKGANTEQDTEFVRETISKINATLKGGRCLASDITRNNAPSVLDIAMLPLFESYLANVENLGVVFAELDVGNIREWYNTLTK